MRSRLITQQILLSIAFFFLHAQVAQSMDGVFDRSEEVAKYLDLINNGTISVAATAAKQIYVSGISDLRLAEAVNARLLRDYPEIDVNADRKKLFPVDRAILNAARPDIEQDYGMCLIKALASFGLEQYESTLKEVLRPRRKGGARIGALRSMANRELAKIAFHRRKNEVMASRENFNQSDDVRTSMLINLLRSDDPKLWEFAFDRIKSERIRSLQLSDVFEQDVSRELGRQSSASVPLNDATMVHGIYILGMSGDRKYRNTLEKVLVSNSSPRAKKQAQVALDRLQ